MQTQLLPNDDSKRSSDPTSTKMMIRKDPLTWVFMESPLIFYIGQTLTGEFWASWDWYYNSSRVDAFRMVCYKKCWGNVMVTRILAIWIFYEEFDIYSLFWKNKKTKIEQDYFRSAVQKINPSTWCCFQVVWPLIMSIIQCAWSLTNFQVRYSLNQIKATIVTKVDVKMANNYFGSEVPCLVKSFTTLMNFIF